MISARWSQTSAIWWLTSVETVLAATRPSSWSTVTPSPRVGAVPTSSRSPSGLCSIMPSSLLIHPSRLSKEGGVPDAPKWVAASFPVTRHSPRLTQAKSTIGDARSPSVWTSAVFSSSSVPTTPRSAHSTWRDSNMNGSPSAKDSRTWPQSQIFLLSFHHHSIWTDMLRAARTSTTTISVRKFQKWPRSAELEMIRSLTYSTQWVAKIYKPPTCTATTDGAMASIQSTPARMLWASRFFQRLWTTIWRNPRVDRAASEFEGIRD